jgi:uncharacterized damage-inducible protein DinB
MFSGLVREDVPQACEPALTHYFNHQAPHWGRVHAGLTIAGIREPVLPDLLVP